MEVATRRALLNAIKDILGAKESAEREIQVTAQKVAPQDGRAA